MSDPTYVSLFAGAGGFDIGFDRAGFRCLAQVEIDKTAREVLARHWPDVPRYEDVRQFGAAQVPSADVVIGGFPCQDVSTAGKRAGFEGGERSSLWFEMVRVIRELRPLWVVWENVPGLLSADEGRAFGWVLRELADLGFDGGWRTVDAQFFGVPQQRRRVFGCFARGDSGAERCAEVLALAESGQRRTPARRKAGPGTAPDAPGGTGGSGLEGFDELNQARTGRRSACLRSGALSGGQLVFGGGDTSGERGVCAALSAKGGTGRQDFDTENFVLTPQPFTVHGEHSTAMTGGGDADVAFPAEVARSLDTTGGFATNQGGTVVCHESGQGWWNESEKSGPLRAEGENRPSRPTHIVCVSGEGVTHALTAKSGATTEDGTGRGTPIVFNWQSGGDCRLNPSELPDAQSVGQTPAVMAFAQNQRGEVRFVDPPPALTAGGGKPGEGYPAAMVAGVVRRLTPRECERLMGWPEWELTYEIELCFEPPKNPATAESRSRKSQRRASTAASEQFPVSAVPAGSATNASPPSSDTPAPKRVRLFCGEERTALTDEANSLLWSVNTAIHPEACVHRVNIAVFAHRCVGLGLTAARITRTGKAGSQPSERLSILHRNGKPCVRLCGSATTPPASGAESVSFTTGDLLTSATTSHPSRSSTCDLNLATSCSFVASAMTGFIPTQTWGASSLLVEVTLRYCHTRYRADGKEIADGPRYRLCGNGVVGTVAEWLANRLRLYGGLA